MLIDLSHTIESGMITYKGLPAPLVCDFLSREASRKIYAPGVEFHIGRIDMVANTGTYLDTPSHRFAGGADVAKIPLDAVADLRAVVLRSTGRTIDADSLDDLDLGVLGDELVDARVFAVDGADGPEGHQARQHYGERSLSQEQLPGLPALHRSGHRDLR